MTKNYLSTRRELTGKVNLYTDYGFICRRTRETCNCRPNLKNPEMYPKANQRNAVIVYGKGGKIRHLFVRCKNCASIPENEKV